jgi:hypothetical protein
VGEIFRARSLLVHRKRDRIAYASTYAEPAAGSRSIGRCSVSGRLPSTSRAAGAGSLATRDGSASTNQNWTSWEARNLGCRFGRRRRWRASRRGGIGVSACVILHACWRCARVVVALIAPYSDGRTEMCMRGDQVRWWWWWCSVFSHRMGPVVPRSACTAYPPAASEKTEACLPLRKTCGSRVAPQATRGRTLAPRRQRPHPR